MKVPVRLGGLTEVVYVDETFWLYYHIADNRFVVISVISGSWPDADWQPPGSVLDGAN